MKAVSFEMSLPRLAAARIAGFFSPAGFVAPFGPTRLLDLPDPRPLRDDWVVVRPRVTGICGSDVKEIFLDASIDNPLRALISFPHVLGHEVAATVVEAGPAVRRVRVGDRVAVSPWLPAKYAGCRPAVTASRATSPSATASRSVISRPACTPATAATSRAPTPS